MSDEQAAHDGTQRRTQAHTAQLLDHIALHATTGRPLAPAPGEPDPREVEVLDEQIALLGPALDGFLDAVAPSGSALGELRERVHWGLVNVVHAQTRRIEREVDEAALALREIVHHAPINDIEEHELRERTDRAQNLYQRLAAVERLHHASAFHYQRAHGRAWRPHANRSYVATQDRYPGAYSNARDSARAARRAQSLQRAENAAPSRAPAPAQEPFKAVVAGDEDYPQREQISIALERLHRKHPDLVVHHLHGTALGDFAAEWARLHEVPERVIGIPRPGDMLDFALSLGRTDNPQLEATHLGEAAALAPIVRRERAILALNPDVVLNFGERRWGAQPYAQLAHDYQLPLWAFDRRGEAAAYRAGQAPEPAQRLPTRQPVYAGIGSRSTPPEVQRLMTEVAAELGDNHFTLRSGAARGADQAFEAGATLARSPKEIYLPNDGFYGRSHGVDGAQSHIPDRAFAIAAEHHPTWQRLQESTRRLHARNTLQVLGADCRSPADVVICWTPQGRDTGGTAQALRIARAHDIPVINLGAADAPRTAEAVIGEIRARVPQWTAQDLEHFADIGRGMPQPPPTPAEYAPERREDFTHTAQTLRHCAERFDQILEVLGPQGTQLSDYRAAIAWGLCHVIDYQLNRLSDRAQRGASHSDDARLGVQRAELGAVRTALTRHHASALGLGPWNRRSPRRTASPTYANLQAQEVLAGRDRDRVAAHRPDTARVLVEGAEHLNLEEHYARLDALLKRVREWHREHEGRDISIVHKSAQSILRTWCENNDVHQHLYQPDFTRHARRAPAMRDRAMVHDAPLSRYVEIDTGQSTHYTRRHVEEFNRDAERNATPPVRTTRARLAPEASPARERPSNVVDIRTGAPLRFSSRSREGAILSNFASTPIRVDGLEWPTVEHYYQASKLGTVRSTAAEQLWRDIRSTASPAQAREAARAHAAQLSPMDDWDERRLGIMAEALEAKFAPGTEAAEYLLSTGDRDLVHETPWGRNGDPFWGAGRNDDGRNLLGAMLEQCRIALRAGGAPDRATLLQASTGIVIDDPAEARVADYRLARERYRDSYARWTESYASDQPRVAEQLADETAELSSRLGRAAQHLLANYERYGPLLEEAEIPRSALEADQAKVERERRQSRTHEQELGARMA